MCIVATGAAKEDVMTCIDWLAKSFRSVVLVGWSMGSAAVVEVELPCGAAGEGWSNW